MTRVFRSLGLNRLLFWDMGGGGGGRGRDLPLVVLS